MCQCRFIKMADDNQSDELTDQIETAEDKNDTKEVPNAEMNGEIVHGASREAQSAGSKKKKKKKKGKCEVGSEGTTAETSFTPEQGLQNLRKLQNLQKSFELLRAGDGKAPKTTEEAMKKKYQFWNTQPVPKLGRLAHCVSFASFDSVSDLFVNTYFSWVCWQLSDVYFSGFSQVDIDLCTYSNLQSHRIYISLQ